MRRKGIEGGKHPGKARAIIFIFVLSAAVELLAAIASAQQLAHAHTVKDICRNTGHDGEVRRHRRRAAARSGRRLAVPTENARSPFKTVIPAVPVSTTTWTHPEMTWPYGAKLSGVASITGRCRVSCTPTERQEVSRGIEQKMVPVLRVRFLPWLGRYSTHRVVVVRTVLHRWIHLSHATTETHIRENLQPHLYIAIKIDRTRGVGTHVHKHR